MSSCVFPDFVKHCSIVLFGKERLGVLCPKLIVLGKCNFSRLWITAEYLSFHALHHQLKGLFASGCSSLSFLKQLYFWSGVLLSVVWSWQISPWRLVWLSCTFRQVPFPSSRFDCDFFRKKNVLHFIWRGKKKPLDLLHGVNDCFQGYSSGSELPSWAWKCQHWCNEESPIEK